MVDQVIFNAKCGPLFMRTVNSRSIRTNATSFVPAYSPPDRPMPIHIYSETMYLPNLIKASLC